MRKTGVIDGGVKLFSYCFHYMGKHHPLLIKIAHATCCAAHTYSNTLPKSLLSCPWEITCVLVCAVSSQVTVLSDHSQSSPQTKSKWQVNVEFWHSIWGEKTVFIFDTMSPQKLPVCLTQVQFFAFRKKWYWGVVLPAFSEVWCDMLVLVLEKVTQ